MKAVILAAGRGSRMKNKTKDIPKCLINLKGKSLLDWQLDAILDAGINHIAIVTGYKREKLIDRGLTEFYNSRWTKTNIFSSLMCANEWLENDQCIVTYSDIFYESSLITLLIES